ncbi:MAG: DinB family protein [Vicinamibacterales bacterium]
MVPWLTLVICRELDDLDKELDLFPDDATVWATVPGITNSAGTIVLHLCGNLQHFIGAKLGGSGYVRNREREFAARDLPRAELKAEIARTRHTVATVLPAVPATVLDEVFLHVPNGMRLPTGLFLLHLATHLSFHLGQAGYLRRALTGETASTGAVGFGGLASAVMP